MLRGEVRTDYQHRRGELAVRPEVGLVDKHLCTRLDHQARRPRFGEPRAVKLAALEQCQGACVVGWRDLHISLAGHRDRRALICEPGAQRDILGVAQLRRGQLCPAQVAGAVEPLAHDQCRTARGRAGDDDQRPSLGLHKAADGRGGADVCGIHCASRQRLDCRGSGGEDRRLYTHLAQSFVEEALLDTDERGGVGEIGKVAQPHLGDLPGFGGRGGASGESEGEGAHERGHQGAARAPRACVCHGFSSFDRVRWGGMKAS